MLRLWILIKHETESLFKLVSWGFKFSRTYTTFSLRYKVRELVAERAVRFANAEQLVACMIPVDL